MQQTGGQGAHRGLGVHEGPEEGGQGPVITHWEGNLMKGGASHSREESLEAGLEDPEVDGVD